MKRLLIYAAALALMPSVWANILIDQMPDEGLLFGDGLSGRASGYNNGSMMNAGRHFRQADDFVLSGDLPWQIDSVSFLAGVQLNATIKTLRVTIYEGDGSPAAIGSHIWQHEELIGDPQGHFQATSTLTDSTNDTYGLSITLTLSGTNKLILSPDSTYYLSIEGDCLNTEDIYNGYDTYYQRFYWALSNDNGQSWGTSQYEGQWQDWQLYSGDFAWSMTGTPIPEPATLLLLALGGLALRRKQRI